MILSLLVPLLLSPEARAGDVLIVGASYVDRNDVEVTTEALLDEGSGADRTVTALAHNGFSWSDHVDRVATDPVWEDALVNTPWNTAFLHEFADVADQPVDSESFQSSLVAGRQIVTWLGANGAQVFVWLTWGDRTGGPHYDDYTGMQDALKTGAEAYDADFSGLGVDVYIAPIGEGFRLIHDASADPLATDSLFTKLYVSDNQHPSPLGSYLAACVMYTSLTGLSPVGLTAGTSSFDAADVPVVQQAAWDAVQNSLAIGYEYPWMAGDDTGDTGVDDTGTGDTGTGDTGTDDTGTDDSGGTDSGDTDTGDAWGEPEPVFDEEAGEGCGCGAPVSPAAVAAVLALAAVGRRRR